ncbi:hypothetical protein LTR53_003392 [Teratosphaeriaceae sp. CCFEE 6253]|nr:hypothetical protein LTR53_003392 [Teratosphaeriaceae sp. CCFEE 6253]
MTGAGNPTPPAGNDSDRAWLNYLRSAGGTIPERSTSTDRKRRHAGAQHEGPGRSYPYPTSAASSSNITTAATRPPRRPSATSTSSGGMAGTAQTPIDLTSPPQPRPRPLPPTHHSSTSSIHHHTHTHSTSRRSSSSLRLPRWQPDDEATQCPVCRTDFGFWNRRHHCRKCGRVVCSACSPHRITIPRQYIVQPPQPFGTEFGVETAGQGLEGEVRGPLGGGEVVRVCNPCVPDPWTPDNASVRGGDETGARLRPLIEGARNAGDATEAEQSAERLRRHYMPPPPPSSRPGVGGRTRSQSHQPVMTSTLSRSIPGQPQQLTPARPSPSSHDRASPRPSPGPPSPHQSRSISHRYSHSHSHSHPYAPTLPLPHFPRGDSAARPPLNNAPSAYSPQARPRRVVREEDECPVCGTELPPGEAIRAAHVQACIAERFSSTPGSSSMPHPPPPPPPRHSSHTGAAPTPHITTPTAGGFNPASLPAFNSTHPTASTTPPGLPPVDPSTAAAARPRAPSHRPRGMALYTATEKDCLAPSASGGAAEEPQECVICLEEFAVGDAMGRMECLCKFHRVCIRGWWERRGGGNCPTHQLHD